LRRGEYHAVKGDGAPFLYLVPAAAVYQLDETSVAVLDEIGERDLAPNDLANSLSARFPLAEVRESIEDLVRVHAIRTVADAPPPVKAEAPSMPVAPGRPRKRIPLTTLVVNVT